MPACDEALSRRLRRLAAGVLGLALASPASAQCPTPVPGPTVGIETTPGSGCWACWTAPTTHTDGTPIELPIGYAVYVYQGTPPILGTTPPTFTTSVHDGVRGVCRGLVPGQQYNVAVTAIEGTAESALSAPFPFIPDAPRKVGGAGIH